MLALIQRENKYLITADGNANWCTPVKISVAFHSKLKIIQLYHSRAYIQKASLPTREVSAYQYPSIHNGQEMQMA